MVSSMSNSNAQLGATTYYPQGVAIGSDVILEGVAGIEILDVGVLDLQSTNSTQLTPPWSCRDCGTRDMTMSYRSGGIKRCFTCQGYRNMEINSAQKAKKLAGLERSVDFTLEEFHLWAASNPRKCTYCEITDEGLWLLDLRTANGKRNEALGIDRLSSDLYSLDNIAWCCYPCNRAKGNYLSSDEMQRLAPTLKSIWMGRLKLRS